MSIRQYNPPDRVHLAVPGDLNAVMMLQDRWRSSVGYIRRSAHADHIRRRDTYLITRDGQEAGYVMAHVGRDRVCHIIQVAVHMDLLRTTIGTRLLTQIVAEAYQSRATMIRLRSGFDLPANHFWPTVGFRRTGSSIARTARQRPLIEWTRQLSLYPDSAARVQSPLP